MIEEDVNTKHLQGAVEGLVNGSEAISSLIAMELPAFTRHDMVHLDNVLYWMDTLVTDEGLEELGTVGCALCILLAYVHDLGMVPTQGWQTELKDSNSAAAVGLRRWVWEKHADLLDLADRCHTGNAEQVNRAEWIERFIRIDYLRATHAEPGDGSRVKTHLKVLANDNSLKKAFGFLGAEDHAIALIAQLIASHNQPVDWLARQLDRKGARYLLRACDGQTNVILPALLLRLADVCDFDSSRTPSVLFHQLGLEGLAPLALGELAPAMPNEQTLAVKKRLHASG